MFSEGKDFWILVYVFRGPRVFGGVGLCFQMTKGSGFWLMFLEAKDFWIFGHVFRGPSVFWSFGSCFQMTEGFLSLSMFSLAILVLVLTFS